MKPKLYTEDSSLSLEQPPIRGSTNPTAKSEDLNNGETITEISDFSFQYPEWLALRKLLLEATKPNLSLKEYQILIGECIIEHDKLREALIKRRSTEENKYNEYVLRGAVRSLIEKLVERLEKQWNL